MWYPSLRQQVRILSEFLTSLRQWFCFLLLLFDRTGKRKKTTPKKKKITAAKAQSNETPVKKTAMIIPKCNSQFWEGICGGHGCSSPSHSPSGPIVLDKWAVNCPSAGTDSFRWTGTQSAYLIIGKSRWEYVCASECVCLCDCRTNKMGRRKSERSRPLLSPPGEEPSLASSSSSSPLTFSVSWWTALVRGKGTLSAPWLKCPKSRPVLPGHFVRSPNTSICVEFATDVCPFSDMKDSCTCALLNWRLLAHLEWQFSGSIFPIREAFMDLAPPQMTLHSASRWPRRFKCEISSCACQNLTNVLGLIFIYIVLYVVQYTHATLRVAFSPELRNLLLVMGLLLTHKISDLMRQHSEDSLFRFTCSNF